MQRSLRSPCTGTLRDESLKVPCNLASKSATGQIYLISEGLTREAGQLVSTTILKRRLPTYADTRKNGNDQVFSG